MDTNTTDTTAQERDGRPPEPETIPHALMPTFIGYARLEQWIATRSAGPPVYLLPLVESGREQGGLRTDTLLVVCQQQDSECRIHYCRLRAADLVRCYGEPFDADWKEREAAWRSLAAAVEAELRSRGFSIVPATVAAPRALRMLEGTSDTIRFDPAARRYRKITS